jgi:predicted MFS family arabinose efflux permease
MPISSTPVTQNSPGAGRRQTGLGAITFVLAAACGLAVANIYFAQPLLGLLARSFHTSEGAVTVVVTVTQIGYALGLFLLLPLGDLIENRKLTSFMLVVTAAALALAGSAPELGVFLIASVVIGLTSVVAQILIPFAAHLTPEASRGQVMGRLNSGLLLGILLARTLSSLVAAAWGWRAIFFISSGLMLVTAVALFRILPARAPDHTAGYVRLMTSIAALVRDEPLLRQRSLRQALVFAGFSAYWTSIAYELAGHHGFNQAEIGLFALVGAVGVAAAPVAGRLADRGSDRYATGAALLLAAVALVIADLGARSVVLLGLAAVLLDIAMTSNQILSQRQIYRLRPDARARLNTVYMGSAFLGGAAGSAIAGALQGAYGWTGATLFGASIALLAFLLWAWTSRGRKASTSSVTEQGAAGR